MTVSLQNECKLRTLLLLCIKQQPVLSSHNQLFEMEITFCSTQVSLQVYTYIELWLDYTSSQELVLYNTSPDNRKTTPSAQSSLMPSVLSPRFVDLQTVAMSKVLARTRHGVTNVGLISRNNQIIVSKTYIRDIQLTPLPLYAW